MDDRAGQHRRAAKSRDRSLALVLAGLVLLMPPVAMIFHLDAKIGGIPFTLIYLFLIWSGLIAGAAYLSRQLGTGDDAAQDRPPRR